MLKKFYRLIALLSLTHCVQSEPSASGLIGGATLDGVPFRYAALVTTPSTVTTITDSNDLFPEGLINSVALNNSSVGLIGGYSGLFLFSSPYAAFTLPNQPLQTITLPLAGQVLSVSLNEANQGLIGGFTGSLFFDQPYAAFVSPNEDPIPLTLPALGGIIREVAINEANLGLIGGRDGTAYAAFVRKEGALVTSISLTADSIFSVALNDSNQGLIGGVIGSEGYAAYVSSSSNAASPISLGPLSDTIQSVAINNTGIGLIGGLASNNDAYAAFVFPNLTFQSINNLPSNGSIQSVALNDLGQGLIGGVSGNSAYAAFISPSGIAAPISGLPMGEILSVAINQFGQGLLGGTAEDSPYAAIVSPLGALTPLHFSFAAGFINSVAINAFFLSQIPIEGLTGNNQIFAEYINNYAPQNVFYFLPSLIDGTIASALESAAPTRNGIFFTTALQNTFYLTTNLSTHLRNHQFFGKKPIQANAKKATAQLEHEEDEDLVASRCFPDRGKCVKKIQEKPSKSKPYAVWFDAIGALAYQDAQKQTPGFRPSVIGGTIAFDAWAMEKMVCGVGASYLYTHIHEKQNAGNGHVNQEDLFLYASWEPNRFYLDLGLWGGLFQTHQTRKINMSGFSFSAHSKPHGWQLVPHLELGWLSPMHQGQTSESSWNLFGMIDWAHAWQSKYKEKGNSPFNTEQMSHHGSLLRTEAGFRFLETFFLSCWNLILLEKASYVNVQAFNPGTVHGFLVGSPGSFTLETLTATQNLGVIQFAITGEPRKRSAPATTLFYQGEFGSSYQSHQLTLECSWNF